MSQTAPKFNIFKSSNSPSGQRIVQCPSCQTKFAVSAGILESIDTPRFHCSRCDHLFTLDGLENRTPAYATQPAIPEERPEESNLPSEQYEAASDIDSAEEPNPEEESYFSTRDSLSSSPALEEEPPASTGTQNPAFQTAEPSLIDTAVLPGQAIVATATTIAPLVEPPSSEEKKSTHDWLNPLRVLRSAAMRNQDESTQPLREEQDEALPAVSSTAILGNALPPPPPPPSADAARLRGGKEKARNTKQAIQVPLPFGGFSPRRPPPAPTEQNAESRQVLGPWKSLLGVAAPCLLLLAILGVVSLSIRSLPASTKERLASVLPTNRRLAPPGLQVVDARIIPLTLDSGEQVKFLTGTVTNQSPQNVSDILVEFGLFAKNGDSIGKERWLLTNSLNGSELKSLTTQSMLDLQSGDLGTEFGKRILKSGTSQQFWFALDGVRDTPKDMAFFSARIHSIR